MPHFSQLDLIQQRRDNCNTRDEDRDIPISNTPSSLQEIELMRSPSPVVLGWCTRDDLSQTPRMVGPVGVQGLVSRMRGMVERITRNGLVEVRSW